LLACAEALLALWPHGYLPYPPHQHTQAPGIPCPGSLSTGFPGGAWRRHFHRIRGPSKIRASRTRARMGRAVSDIGFGWTQPHTFLCPGISQWTCMRSRGEAEEKESIALSMPRSEQSRHYYTTR